MDLKAQRKQAIHTKISATTYGEVATFAPTDAILCGDINVDAFNVTAEERKNMQAYFGSQGSIVVKKQGKISFKTELAGSGIAGTPPRSSPLFRACNLNEVILAAPITGIPPAIGTANTIVLDATASAIDGFYNGMHIEITAGAGLGSKSRIIAYNGTTKTVTTATPVSPVIDNSSTYSIAANVRYIPHSEVDTNAGSDVCIRWNEDGVEHIFLGARGNVKLMLDANKIPTFDWEFTGLIGTIDDLPPAVSDFTGIPIPLGVMTNNIDAFNCHGLVAPNAIGSSLNVDLGNDVKYPDLFGQDAVLITDRKVKLSVKVLATTLAVKNWYNEIEGAVLKAFAFSLGKTAGNRVSVVAENMHPKSYKSGNIDGIVTADIEAELRPSDRGNDDLIIVFD